MEHSNKYLRYYVYYCRKVKKGKIIFILLFFSISIYYGCVEILVKRPQSIHRWRQTDSGSIAYNYYAKDYNLFHPQVLYQGSNGGESGYAVGEFPGYYFLIATLWKLFGYSDFIYRLVSFILFFIGIYHLFKLSFKFLEDKFWSIAISLTFMTSTVVVYYANSFTTDIPAFSISITATYYLFLYHENLKRKNLIVALCLFTIAGLIKVTSIMPFLGILGIYCLNSSKLCRIEYLNSNFKLTVKKTLAFLFVLILIITWYRYAVYYNKLNYAAFFSTQIFPIWDLSKDEIINIWNYVLLTWKNDYFNYSTFWVFTIMFFYLIFFLRKINPFFRTFVFFLFIGLISYISLWYFCFHSHDYYFIHTLYFLFS